MYLQVPPCKQRRGTLTFRVTWRWCHLRANRILQPQCSRVNSQVTFQSDRSHLYSFNTTSRVTCWYVYYQLSLYLNCTWTMGMRRAKLWKRLIQSIYKHLSITSSNNMCKKYQVPCLVRDFFQYALFVCLFVLARDYWNHSLSVTS